MSYSFKIDSSCTIDSEEFEETKDAIDCMAAELDSEFLDIAVKVEEPEYHRDGPIVAKVHGGGAYAELDAEEYDVDVTDFPLCHIVSRFKLIAMLTGMNIPIGK